MALSWSRFLRADAAEAAKVARHENLIQRSDTSNERRGRDERGQDMRPGKPARITFMVLFRQLCDPQMPKQRALLSMPCAAGDWLCPSCNVVNFASRQECFKCSEAR